MIIIHFKKNSLLVDFAIPIHYIISQFIKKHNLQALPTLPYNLIKVEESVMYIVIEEIKKLELIINCYG